MECPICLIDTKNEFNITTPCNHTLCLGCFLKLKKMLCPICRNDLKDKLPKFIIAYFNKKKEKEKNTQAAYNLIDLNDQYEFPPLG